MITILHIAEIILYIILAFNTGYLLLFAIASKFCRPRIYPRTAPGTKFAVLFLPIKKTRSLSPPFIPSYSKITHENYMTLS